MRQASQATRFEAQRFEVDRFGSRRASREADLAADYLDAFGEAVDAAIAPQAWPRILVLDSKPLGVRAYRADAWGADEQIRAGALLMAVGKNAPSESSRCWRIGLAGDETAASWFDFLSEIEDGEPEWVVFDGANAIAEAVKARWPQAIAYACEYHLRQNLEAVAHADAVALDPAMGAAVRRAQWSVADWDTLSQLARSARATHIRKWIGQRGAQIRRQIEHREAHRGYPRGNGPAENMIVKVDAAIEHRRFNFRNARRLQLLLSLMRAELAGDADTARYARIIKDAIEAAHGRPLIDWDAHHDPIVDPCSLSELLVLARERAEAAQTTYMTQAKARSVVSIVADGNAKRAAAGLPLLQATVSPGRRTASVKVRGMMLSDFPDIFAEWADDLNDVDKATIRAGTDRVVHWRCAAGHTWRAPVSQRTIRQTRCGDCFTERADTTNSVATLWLELLEEWDADANRPLTPERTKITYARAVWWRCLKNLDHPRYKMTPRTRGGRDVGCGTCRREARERAARQSPGRAA